MPVALHVAADHRAIQHVERGEQRGRAVPNVVALGWTAPRHRVPAAWSSQHKQKGRPPWRLSALPWKGPSMSSSCTASFAEDEEIALLQAQGCGVREVARWMGRDASTIPRTASQRGHARWRPDVQRKRPNGLPRTWAAPSPRWATRTRAASRGWGESRRRFGHHRYGCGCQGTAGWHDDHTGRIVALGEQGAVPHAAVRSHRGLRPITLTAHVQLVLVVPAAHPARTVPGVDGLASLTRRSRAPGAATRLAPWLWRSMS